MRHLSKSTTLFPQRVHSGFSLSKKFESTTEFCKSESDALECNAVAKSDNKNYNVHQSSEVSHQSSGKTPVTMPSKPASKKSSSGGSESSPKRRRTLPMTSLKCFLCNKIIKIENLSEHLLFGEVHCTKCPAVFQNCQCFQAWTTEQKLGNSHCEHALQYSVNPMQNLEMHLSNQYLENGTSCRASLIDKPHHLRAYVNGMNSLKHRLPWKEAVLCFKQGGKKPRGKKFTIIKEDRESKKHSAYNNSDDNCGTISDMNDLSKHHSQDLKTVPVLQDAVNSAEKEHVSINQQLGSLNVPSAKQDESAPLSLNSRDSLSNSSPVKKSLVDKGVQNIKKRSEVRKRRRSEWISGIRKRNHTPKNNPRVDYVETPLNGFYYVVRQAVSECPNCYAKISPPDFTVNIVTFLMTAVCADCSLTIYIVHDPPDDSSPRVCIVTGEEKRRSMKKKTSQKSRKLAAVVES
ncbi:uncharacterized protein [Palaemon carinicauda]|uniref:uncharacterized protein n=1 Tax=Palaemon carinicauda TaxID=392227 RepID=UPI0035B69BFD